MTSTGRAILMAVAVVSALNAIVPLNAPAAEEAKLPLLMTRVGEIISANRGGTIECRFSVPPGTQQLDIDVVVTPTDPAVHIDLGLRSPEGIRGWSEDRLDHVHIDSTSASYGYLPGPMPPGDWALLLGVGYVPDELRIRYKVQIRLSDKTLGSRPVLRSNEGWY